MQFQKDKYKNKGRPKKVYIQDNTPDSENGEMVYTDPSGNQIMSPIVDSQEQMMDYNDQTDPQKGKSIFQTVRNDLKNNSDMVQLVSDQPIPSLVVNIPSRNGEEDFERSPQTINVDRSSRDDNDYNIHTLNARKSPKNMYQNDEYIESPYDDDDYQGYDENPRTALYSRSRSPKIPQNYASKNMSPHSRPVVGGIVPINKMSPTQNYDELNDSGEKNTEQNQYNNLRNYLGNNRDTNRQVITNPNNSIQNQNVINPQRDEVGNKYNNKTYNNMSYKDIKKIANRFTRVYDPNRNTNGLLVEESQVTVPGAEDEIFNNRYKVLAKMNRLSNILLAKQRNRNLQEEKPFNAKTYNRERSYDGNTKKNFNRHTLAKSPEDKRSRRAFSRSPDHKFLYVSLAMISSKGPSCEDKPILRRMRLEKGGVVDLAQEDLKKNKFKIKKAQRKQGTKRNYFTNPKYREKAAKIIQGWWRDLKNIYNDRMKKIIKIQSVFRGRFVRKYMYDLFYLNFLYISFCKKIENVLKRHIRPYVWDKLFGRKRPQEEPEEEEDNLPERDHKLKKLVSRDYRNDLESIYPVWKKWISNARKLGVQNSKGRNLVQIRADKEKKLGDIRNAFNKWVYVKKILDAQDKLLKDKKKKGDKDRDKETDLKKIKGFFQLMKGIDQYTKKESMNQVLPKLENYLKDQKGKGKLKKLVYRKPNYNKNLLRKYLYRWYGNAINEGKNDNIDPNNERLENLKRNVFKNILMKVQKKQANNILRKYFYKWLKKAIKLAIKEEKNKAKQREKDYKNKEYEIIEEYEKKITTYENQKKEDDEVSRKIREALEKYKRDSKQREDELRKSLEQSKDKHDKNLLNYLKGSEILQRAVWRITHEDPLNAMGDKLYESEVKYKLLKLVKIKKLTDNNLLRKYFNRWKINALKGVDPNVLYKLLAKLIEITSNNHKKKILSKKFNKWRRAAGINPYDSLQKARDLYDLVDYIKEVFIRKFGDDFLNRLDKARNPKYVKKKLLRLYKLNDKDNKKLLRKAFDKWRNIINKESVKMLKSKLIYKIYDKNISGQDRELLNKYFQKWKNITFKDNLRKYKKDLDRMNSMHNDTKILYVKSVVNNLDKRTNKDLLREYFNKWKRILDLDRDKKNKADKKSLLLSKIFDKRSNVEYINLLQYLLRWRNKMLEMRAKEAHKPFRKQVIKILLTKNDKEELQRCFTKWKYGGLKRLPIMPYIVAKRFLKKVLCRRAYNEFVKKMNERNPRVLKSKGKDLYKTLKDLKDKRLRDFLKKLMIHIQTKYLGEIQPRVNDKIREHYLRKYFDRWVENTLGEAQRKRDMLANWLKNKFEQDQLNRENRINDLLTKFIDKKEQDKKLTLAYAFFKYYKNTKLDKQIEYAKVIQKFCRSVLDTTIRDKIENQKRLADFLDYLYRRKALDDLYNLARNASPLLKDSLKKKKAKLDKLRKTVKHNDRIKNLDILRKYWDIWKNNKGLLEKYSVIIQKQVRTLISKKKLRLMRRLNDILLKLIATNEDKELDILRSRFYQWLAIKRSLECHDNARIIQKFCRNKLDNYLRNKLSNYLEKLAKKYGTYLVNNAAKVNELDKALKHKPFNDFIDALRRRCISNDILDILYDLLYKHDDKNRKILLRRYLDKWRKKVDRMLNREDDAAERIQAVFRGHDFRKYFYLDEKRIRILTRIVEKLIMASNPDNYLRSALAKWRKNVAKLACHENARIIQDFCREIRDKIMDDKIKRNLDNYKTLAKTLNTLKVSPVEFLDRLKEIRRNQIFDELLNNLAQKRLDTLKDVMDRIRDYPKSKYLKNIMPIQDDLRDRILRKYLNIWRNKAMRSKLIMEILRSIFSTFDDFKNNLIRYNLYRWQYKARYLTQKKQARIISEFCKPIIKYQSVLKNWHKLADGLRNKDRDQEIEDALDNLRRILGFEKLKKPIVHNARKTVLDLLNKNSAIKQFMKKIRPYFNKNDDYWRRKLLKEYFDKWRRNATKLSDKEYALLDMMDVLDKLRKKNAANKVADASLLKKFLHDYPLIRALGFLRKLKELARQRGKNDNLAQDLVDAKNNLEPQKKRNLIKKLFKVYAYKVLDKLFKTLAKKQNDNLTPLKKEFLDKLFKNLKKKAERLYTDRKENETVPKNKKTSFRLKKPTKLKDDQKKKLIYVSLLPSLFKYINNKILKQKQDAFDAIKRESNANKFCDLYKRWTKKQHIEPKRELIDKLRRIYKNVTLEGPLKLKLFKLLRREAIRRMLKKSRKVNKVLGMMYVTRLLVMQRDLAKERFLRQLIRRWRFIAFSKKLALNKMKTIYKNLHMTYLEVASTLFGDEEKNDPSVIKEFERFGTSVGLWENERPNEKGEEKYVKKIKTAYVFDPTEFEKFQNKYYPTEFEEEEYYEEDKKETEKKVYKTYREEPKKKK